MQDARSVAIHISGNQHDFHGILPAGLAGSIYFAVGAYPESVDIFLKNSHCRMQVARIDDVKQHVGGHDILADIDIHPGDVAVDRGIEPDGRLDGGIAKLFGMDMNKAQLAGQGFHLDFSVS